MSFSPNKFKLGFLSVLLLATLILPQKADASLLGDIKCFFSWIFTASSCKEEPKQAVEQEAEVTPVPPQPVVVEETVVV